MTFAAVAEQHEAKRLLSAALAEGPAHAYLLHGPPGVGKRALAMLFAAELLGDHARVERRTHPDLYVLEPVGDQIRIDDIRTLRSDLHMRPYEASRRVYLILDADTMNEDAADALLKDLEEPPSYAVILLLASDLGPLPETIRSRCQLVPFRRLSEGAVRAEVRAARTRSLGGGRNDDRARRGGTARPCRAAARSRRAGTARRTDRRRAAVYLDPAFDAGDGAQSLLEGIRERGAEAKEKAEETVAVQELTGREAEQRVRRAQRGAERDELLAALEELEWWYRDLVVARRRRRAGRRCTSTGSKSFAPTRPASGSRAPNVPASSSGRPGGRPRSSSSRCRSPSRRCSSGCAASSPDRKFSPARPSLI